MANSRRKTLSEESSYEPDELDTGYIYYNETVIDHFLNPRNIGELKNPDGMATVGDPFCGDYLRATIRVGDGRIREFKFLTQGCPGAIATSSIATEVAIGKTLTQALELNDNDVIQAAGGIPARKVHCSLLAIRALHEAIRDYLARNEDQKGDRDETANDH
jgi:nitrogen fixation NifU-like protein